MLCSLLCWHVSWRFPLKLSPKVGALGDHVAQRGSLNAADRLRFDFSHSKAMSTDELRQVEAEVNEFIRQNTRVETRIMTPDDARALGAQALFGEKYGDEVRVVSMVNWPDRERAMMATLIHWNSAAVPMCVKLAILVPLLHLAIAQVPLVCAGSRP